MEKTDTKNYVIVRHEKHHSMGTIGASSEHTMRSRDTPNADPDGLPPEVWVGTNDPAADVRALLPAKRRKNAVLAIEYLVTASPDFFKQEPPQVWRAYLQAQLDMLSEYYGKENIASAVLHQDEKSPHLAIQIVPLVDGKLNARALIGTREACQTIQDLAGKAGAPFGLARGEPGSKAKHKEIRKWYAELAPQMKSAEAVIAKAKEVVREAERVETQRAKLQKWDEQLQKQADALVDAFEVLPLDVQDKLSAIFSPRRAQAAKPAAPPPKPDHPAMDRVKGWLQGQNTSIKPLKPK